jgi:hypothetical protein
MDLPFLENLRSNWVVVIGLELLSLACLSLGLGSYYVTSLCLCHPCHYYGYLNPTSMRLGFGVTGLGTCRCNAGGSRLLSGAMLEPYG